ncbi:MAG: hypothetical protein AAF740_08235 [Bacteroidota bacterium]
MHIHQISSVSHQDLLSQERNDPVTGETIKDGDQIVFCAGCRSAFLLESWEYMGKQHCGQSDTLAEFPAQEALSLKRTVVDVKSFKLRGLLFHLGRPPEDNPSENLLHILLLFILDLLIDFYHLLDPGTTRFWSFYKNGIYVGGQRPEGYLPIRKSNWRLRFSDISVIRLTQQKRRLWLEIVLKDRRRKQIKVPRGSKKAVFWGLKRAAMVTNVEIQIHNEDDLNYLRFMRDRQEARFHIL